MNSRLMAIILSLTFPTTGIASTAPPRVRAKAEQLNTLLRVELLNYYSNTRIDLVGSPKKLSGPEIKTVQSVRFHGDNSRGEALLSLQGLTVDGSEGIQEVGVTFAAWQTVLIARQRIRPGEKLGAERFELHDINVALSPNKEVRGLILLSDAGLGKLEANQTILEGQYVLSSAVRDAPDVLRGDSVRIRILTGDLSLSTLGVADEPGVVGHNIRVLSGKNKRQLTGRLLDDHSIEVTL